MNIETALNKLFALHQFGVKLGLDNIYKLLDRIGNPQKNINGFHIAGSNGKGSTASFISSILQEAGFNVGLYTSPHFVKFNERIRINGIPIHDDFVRIFMTELDEYIELNSPTFFELTTALAFKYFADYKVDYVVIETGLGGRLDATNTFSPIASIITSISLEHTNILGNTLSEIAREKAGIIKNNSRAFISSLAPEAKQIFIEDARQKNSELIFMEDNLELYDDYIKIPYVNDFISLYKTPMPGVHQLRNASLAALTIINTIDEISINCVLNGINNVVKNTGIEGRYEIYNKSPRVIFDSAHNAEGVEIFLKEFANEKNNYGKTTVIYGAMKDKNISDIIEKLIQNFDSILVTTIEYERAATIDELMKICKKAGISAIPLISPADYIKDYITNNEGNCLVVIGSIYILGEIKANLINNT